MRKTAFKITDQGLKELDQIWGSDITRGKIDVSDILCGLTLAELLGKRTT